MCFGMLEVFDNTPFAVVEGVTSEASGFTAVVSEHSFPIIINLLRY